MLVPWKYANAPSNTDEYTFTPGAATSGLIRAVNGVGPRLEKPAMMSAFAVMNSCGFVPSTVAVPDGLIEFPSLLPSIAAGIVGNSSPSCAIAVGSPATLFTISTPTAPAAWAFRTFVENVQTPRSINAILPVRAVEIAEQPFAGLVTV